MYCYKYPHAALTADTVVFGKDGESLKVLLIERGGEPYKGKWAFPGGFMNMDETLEQCAIRELEEETGLRVKNVKPINSFSAVDRDPRERVVTMAYYTVINISEVHGGDDAAAAKWFPLDNMPPLAFDHELILQQALNCLKRDNL